MMKLGVQYADGVIQGSETINPEVAEYIAASGKLSLGYQKEDTYIDAYNAFYDKVL